MTAHAHLDSGLRYEQAGLASRAIAAYEAALTAGADLSTQAEAHLRLARVHRSESDWESAAREARLAVRLAEEACSDDLAAEAMNVEVGVFALRGEFEAADVLALSALERARSPRVRGIVLQNRGSIAAQRRDFVAASRLFAESVDAFEQEGYDLGMAIALNNVSAALRDAGEPERAVNYALQAAALARHLGAFDILVLAIQNQAHALIALGQPDEAESLLGEVLGHFAATRNVLRQAECLEIMGNLYAVQPDGADTAMRCFDLAGSLAERVGSRFLADRIAARLAEVKRRAPLEAGPADVPRPVAS
jgi:tetratricopeptide (TPR) repeat protein